MDNKQKRFIFKSTYKAVFLVTLVLIAWVIYTSAAALYQKTSTIYWLDISMIAVLAYNILLIFINAIRTRKGSNQFVLAYFFYAVAVLVVGGIIGGGLYCYYQNISIANQYIIQISATGAIYLLLVMLIVLSVKIVNVSNTVVISPITSDSPTPTYNDELLLKKKLDELKRKVDIKKVQDQINKVQEELDKYNK